VAPLIAAWCRFKPIHRPPNCHPNFLPRCCWRISMSGVLNRGGSIRISSIWLGRLAWPIADPKIPLRRRLLLAGLPRCPSGKRPPSSYSKRAVSARPPPGCYALRY
jgi:hypothetical protein